MKEITAEELNKIKNEFVIVDIREIYEREEEGFIQESISMPLSNINDNLEAFLEKNKSQKLVIHCHAGKRSSMVIKDLIEFGLFPEETLYNLRGGFSAWKESNGEVKFYNPARKM